MCGIIGLLDFTKSGMFANERDFIKELLVYNSVRGSHSTGLCGIQNIGESPDYVKAVGNPYDLFSSHQAKKFFDAIPIKYRYVLGHGRHATRGLITAENAHPFQVDQITMVHNGTVHSSPLVKAHEHMVDSKAIAHALADHSKEEVVADIRGAFALAWHDSYAKEINIVRNEDRPLYLLTTKEDRFIIVSEGYMGMLAASRRGYKIAKMIEIPEYTIFTFSKELGFNFKETKVKKKSFISLPVQTKKKEEKPSFKYVGIGGGKETKVTLKQRVKFWVDTVLDLGKKKDGNHVWQVIGSVDGIDSLEVTFIHNGQEEELWETVEWEGTVQSIVDHKNASEKHLKYLAYLSNVSKVQEMVV